MSNTSIYIGTSLLDFNGVINVKRQVNDYRDPAIGASNKSYTLDLPLTPGNRSILKFVNDIRSKEQVSDQARILIDGLEVIRGKLRILSNSTLYAKGIIEADDWIDEVKGTSIRDLSWAGGDDHTFTSANIVASWTAAAGAFYRYPLINFAELYSEQYQADAAVYPYDFYPMWNIEDIVRKIFADAGYTLASGSFFDGTFGQALYLLSAPVARIDDFIAGKALSVYVDDGADNYNSQSVAASASGGGYINGVVMDIDAETEDEGSDFNVTNNRYVAPENGCYRLKVTMSVYSNQNIGDGGDWTVTSNQLSWSMRKNGVAFETKTASGNDTFDVGNQFTIDSGWIYLAASDYIDIYLTTIRSVATNNTAGALFGTVYVMPGAAVSFLEATWDERNLWPGIGETISPTTHLPDIDTVDFLKGIKEFANLRFWMDRANRTIYIETSDDFYGTTIVDWSDMIDYSSEPEQETAAASYKKMQRMLWAPDEGDKAYSNYVAENGIPYEKIITLTNEYAMAGIEPLQNSVFSPTVLGNMNQMRHYSGKVPRILGSEEFISASKPYPPYRAKQWNPRILEWKGMVALTTGSFDYYDDIEDTSAANYTTFPSAETPDMSDIYDEYWLKDYRRIDENKIVTAVLKIKPYQIIPFTTVVGTATNEGFRAKYKLNIEGIDMYFYMTKITTDGDRVKCEFMQIL